MMMVTMMNYTMRSVTWRKHLAETYHVHFSKQVISTHDGSAEATRGSGKVSQIFFIWLIGVFVFDSLQIRSGGCTHLHSSGYGPSFNVLGKCYFRTKNATPSCEVSLF
jgi:hypothetical protein